LSAETLPQTPLLSGEAARERAQLGSSSAGRGRQPREWGGGRAHRHNTGSADLGSAEVLSRRPRGGTAHCGTTEGEPHQEWTVRRPWIAATTNAAQSIAVGPIEVPGGTGPYSRCRSVAHKWQRTPPAADGASIGTSTCGPMSYSLLQDNTSEVATPSVARSLVWATGSWSPLTMTVASWGACVSDLPTRPCPRRRRHCHSKPHGGATPPRKYSGAQHKRLERQTPHPHTRGNKRKAAQTHASAHL